MWAHISSLGFQGILTVLLLLLLLLIGVSFARPVESVNTLSVQRPQPDPTYPWKEQRDKTVGDKKEAQIMPTGKHWLRS